jgi:hypothetical protein
MANRTLDFDKVDAAFQHLGHTAEGHKVLEALNGVINQLHTSVKPGLNSFELRYVLQNLIQQRDFSDSKGATASAAPQAPTVASGFRIQTAVPA